MRARTRFWTVAALAVVLGLWAVVVERLLVLVGAAVICAWLLAGQYRFLKAAETTVDSLTVDQAITQSQVATEETTVLTLSVDSPEPLPVDLLVTPTLPAGTDGEDDPFHLGRGEREGTRHVDVGWPVAGAFTINQPAITLRDRLGLFEQTVSMGPEQTVRVQPRAPRNVHVGEGGDPVAAGFGEHDAGLTGSGLEPAQIREYVPGQTVRNIDWKATARLGKPHVREFEAETDRATALFVDHRSSLGTGMPGETKLDFLRQVGFAFVDSARELSDSLGCYTVGSDGLTGSFAPDGASDHLLSIRRHLQSLELTDPRQTGDRGDPVAPGRAQTVGRRLSDDTTAYSRRLSPFFDSSGTYVERVTDQPLVAAVRSVTSRHDGALWSVILTDDERQTETREAVKLARRGEGGVLVFVAPTVLYEPGGLGDLDEAYDRYARFEQFRTSLASMDRVSAFEVGPADRLSAVLAGGREQWAAARESES